MKCNDCLYAELKADGKYGCTLDENDIDLCLYIVTKRERADCPKKRKTAKDAE